MSNVPRKGSDSKSAGSATIKYTHQSAFNEIVGMTHVGLSHYFIAHWLPKISPNGLRILIQLRAQGYYNPKDGCKRGDIDIEQSELAALIGVSTKTIQRAFAEDAILCKYVQRIFQVKRDKFGRILKEHYVYAVVMDDVLTAEDQERYQIMLHGPDKPVQEVIQEEQTPNGQNVASDADPKRHSVALAGQSDAPKRHNDASEGQSVASYKESLTLLTKENTLNTPAAAPEFSASLFQDKEPDKKEPEKQAVHDWKTLPPEQQQPFRTQAKHELLPYATQAGPKSWARMGPRQEEVRARNLYEQSFQEIAKKGS